MVKNLPANAGDTGDKGSIPGLGRSPVIGNGNLLQYSWLENSMDREAWQATVYEVTESDTTEHTHMHVHCSIIWKKCKSSLMDKWIKKMWDIYIIYWYIISISEFLWELHWIGMFFWRETSLKLKKILWYHNLLSPDIYLGLFNVSW